VHSFDIDEKKEDPKQNEAGMNFGRPPLLALDVASNGRFSPPIQL
jgi:hypothetical protein